MSRASEWAARSADVKASTPTWTTKTKTETGHCTLDITDDGKLRIYVAGVSGWGGCRSVEPDEARRMARWILDTFGE